MCEREKKKKKFFISMSKSYYQQFQEDIRNKQRHVPFSKGTAGHRSPPTRPTAVVKQPPNRSNTFTLPKKNEEKSNKTTNALPRLKPAPPPPPKKKTLHPISTPFRPPAIKPTPPMAEQRRPVRFASEVNNAYPSASSARTNLPPAAPQRSMRVIHDNYSHSQHRNAYTDYPSSSVSVYPHTSFPPIRASSSVPPPQVIIRSKESYPRPPVPLPSYPPTTAPFMILPSPPMFLPSNYPYPLPPAPVPSTSIVNQASASTSSKVDSHPPTLILPPVQEKKNVTVQLQVANEVGFFIHLSFPLLLLVFLPIVQSLTLIFLD